MRYILNNNYVRAISFDCNITCDGVDCIQYTGSIPTNYNSLEEWASNAVIQSYYISNGDLVYDASKAAEIAATAAAEATYNETASKGYVSDNYYNKIQVDHSADIFNCYFEEIKFKTEALEQSFNLGLDGVVIEFFDDTDNIDQTKDNGAAVVANYYDPIMHCINKTSSDTLTIQSTTFTYETTPYDAWLSLDYEGAGTITAYICKNATASSPTWIALTNNDITSLNVLVQKDCRIRLVLNGVVKLKNIAWGVK